MNAVSSAQYSNRFKATTSLTQETSKAVDTSGNESTAVISEVIVPLKTTDDTTPEQVNNLTATADVVGNRVTLSWNNPSDSDFVKIAIAWNEGGNSREVNSSTDYPRL